MIRRSTLIIALLALVCIAIPTLARANHTLAVLPLTKGAGSEQYDGLGQALAGMLIADLSAVESLTLVERERLDALLEEMSLSETGFVDPATAQKLGSGLGAELVLTGTFSVIEATFMLDARVVRVESGEILKAAATSGTLDDFISVEKELVENILEGIAVAVSASDRRAIYVQAPTERFDAFAKYGEGLAREDEGKIDEARSAFEAAVTLDPKFEAAKAALGALRSLVDTERRAHEERETEYVLASHAAIMATYPDERTIKKGVVDDKYSGAGFALRMMVLENEEDHCQRFEEMWHFAERYDWQISEPPRGDTEGVFSWIVGKEAEKLGFTRLDRALDGPPAAYDSPSSRAYRMWRTTFDFIFDGQDHSPWQYKSGLVASMERCFTAAEQLDKIDEIAKKIAKAGLLDHQPSRVPKTGLTFGESLDFFWMFTHARHFGASDEITSRSEAILARHTDDEDDRKRIVREIEDIARVAEDWQKHQTRRGGRSEAAIIKVLTALVEEDEELLLRHNPVCAYAISQLSPSAAGMLEEIEEEYRDSRIRYENEVDRGGTPTVMLEDLGCIAGVKPRWKTEDEVLEFIRTIPDRVTEEKKDDPTCTSSWSTLKTLSDPATIEVQRSAPNGMAKAIFGIVKAYYGTFVSLQCADGP